MKYFKESEFKNFAKMDPALLFLLDWIRHASNMPFHITSDYRTVAQNKNAGGSAGSLHLCGCAVDFTIDDWSQERMWRIVSSVMLSVAELGRGVELELVSSPADMHIHLGLFPDNRPSRLKLAIT